MKLITLILLSSIIISCSTDDEKPTVSKSESTNSETTKTWDTSKAIEEFCKCASGNDHQNVCIDDWIMKIEQMSDHIDAKKMAEGMIESNPELNIEVLSSIVDQSNQ